MSIPRLSLRGYARGALMRRAGVRPLQLQRSERPQEREAQSTAGTRGRSPVRLCRRRYRPSLESRRLAA